MKFPQGIIISTASSNFHSSSSDVSTSDRGDTSDTTPSDNTCPSDSSPSKTKSKKGSYDEFLEICYDGKAVPKQAIDVDVYAGNVVNFTSVLADELDVQSQKSDDKSKSWTEEEGMKHTISDSRQQHRSEGEIRMAMMGVVSRKSMKTFGLDQEALLKAIESESQTSEEEQQHMTQSKNFMQKNFHQKKVSFSDADDGGITQSLINTDTEKVEKEVDFPLSNSDSGADGEKEEEDKNDTLVFSTNELLKKDSDSDILTEGQYYLGISMLVYMYSHLRETCRMGHTRCKMYEIDVHSLQSQYHGGKTSSYLGKTKSAGSIIRSVVDELDYTDENEEENDIIGDESKEYEKR